MEYWRNFFYLKKKKGKGCKNKRELWIVNKFLILKEYLIINENKIFYFLSKFRFVLFLSKVNFSIIMKLNIFYE